MAGRAEARPGTAARRRPPASTQCGRGPLPAAGSPLPPAPIMRAAARARPMDSTFSPEAVVEGVEQQVAGQAPRPAGRTPSAIRAG